MQVKHKTRLFVGNVPKCKTHTDLEKTFYLMTSGLKNVISFPSHNPTSNNELGNRGFCFLDYTTYGAAICAKERLMSMKIFGTDLFIDWAKFEKPNRSEL